MVYVIQRPFIPKFRKPERNNISEEQLLLSVNDCVCIDVIARHCVFQKLCGELINILMSLGMLGTVEERSVIDSFSYNLIYIIL